MEIIISIYEVIKEFLQFVILVTTLITFFQNQRKNKKCKTKKGKKNITSKKK